MESLVTLVSKSACQHVSSETWDISTRRDRSAKTRTEPSPRKTEKSERVGFRRGERGTMNGESSSVCGTVCELRLEPGSRALEGGLSVGGCAFDGSSGRTVNGQKAQRDNEVSWCAPSPSILLRSLPFLLRLKIRLGLVATGKVGWLWDICVLAPTEVRLLSLSAVFSMARLTTLALDSRDDSSGDVLGGEEADEVQSGGSTPAPTTLGLGTSVMEQTTRTPCGERRTCCGGRAV